MANFQDNLGGRYHQIVTILDLIGDKDDGSGGDILELSDVQSSSQIITTNIPTPNIFTGRMPFLSPNQQLSEHKLHQTDSTEN